MGMRRSTLILFLVVCLIFVISPISYGKVNDFQLSQFSDDYKSVVIFVDLDTGDIYHANKFAADYYGYDREQLTKMNFYDLSKDMSFSLEEILDKEDVRFVAKQKSASGETLHVKIRAFSYETNDGDLALVRVDDISEEIELEGRVRTIFRVLIGVITSLILASTLALIYIGKLERTSKEVENYNDLLHSFFHANKNGIFLKDKDFRYILANEVFAKYMDRDLSDIIGKTDSELLDEELANYYRDDDLKVLEADIVMYNEVRLKGVIQRTTKFPVKLIDGGYGIGAYVEDISEEHKNKEKLKDANLKLDEEKERLQLILDSTSEGIYGLDVEGNCTFINNSGLRILGYDKYKEVIGKFLHNLIHHSYKNGELMEAKDCKILNILKTGIGVKVNDEVLWRKDGRSFDAEYIANPQYKDGKITGVVVTFSDITDRKKAEEEILYLSYHDGLTGLYNRRFFEVEFKRLNVKRNLPLSMIIGDVNGLKLTNDIFGHVYGDELIIKAAKAIKSSCREDDIVARWGGDEFVVLLPATDEMGARKIIERIKENISKQRIRGLEIGMSLGYATRHNESEDSENLFKFAEANMYEEKTLHYKNKNNKITNSILNIIQQKTSKENEHSIRVGNLSEEIGKALGIEDKDLESLKDAGYYHDIGELIMQRTFTEMGLELGSLKTDELKQHPTVAYRILVLSKETEKIGLYVLHHHENWDGTGFPEGLKGEEIPLFSRIIGLAEFYLSLIDGFHNGENLSKKEAIERVEENSGRRFDPKLVKILKDIVE